VPKTIVVPQADLLTVPEAASFLRLQPSTIRAWILQRKIPFVKLGHRAVRFRRCDLEKFITGSLVSAEVLK
jgi:excisionase family DNA binding protein